MKKLILASICLLSCNVHSADFPSEQEIKKEMDKVKNQTFKSLIGKWLKKKQKAN
ncbi:hypothetical protein [Acinetobacter baumannii]|uniref:hypothetical protein n=1 Tax=Acinetobacter baumannii TaxID=470 RepID=UPI001D18F2FB|nr:hypothetical protein [Acinetobacter baumannii]